MTLTIVELVFALAAILGAAIFFTNAVEILGERLNLGSGAVGSLLAAVGTALPETMIPVVALIGAALSGGSAGEAAGEIGIGAILGAPFLLATLGMFVVGASVLGFQHRRENGTDLVIDKGVASRDIAFFFVCFAVATGLGIVALPMYVKIVAAILLVGAYAGYVWRTIVSGGESMGGGPDDLTLWPESYWGQAPTWIVAGQLLASLVVMVAGAHFFVQVVEHLSDSVGVPAGLISLILAPLATELPEKFNSIIWLREDKDTLAFGNISGAMVFQSTIPVALGLLLTRWELGFLNTFSVILALIAGAGLFVLLMRQGPIKAWYLLGGGVFYVVFVVVAIFSIVF